MFIWAYMIPDADVRPQKRGRTRRPVNQAEHREGSADPEPTPPISASMADTIPPHGPAPGPTTTAVPQATPVTAAEAIQSPAPAAQTPRRLRPHRVHWPRLRPVHLPVRVHTLDSLRYRNYRLLWVSMSCVSGAVWTQSLVIGWLTYYLTGSALLTSLALGLATLPYLGSPLAGVIADRWDRRKLLASVSVSQAVLMAGFSAVVGPGLLETWHIFAFVLAMGASWAVSDPARIALIPNTVPKRSLLNAFALNALAFNVMRLVVPAVAGVLVGLVGPGPTLALGEVLYAGAAITALAIDLPLATDETKGRLRPWAQLIEGARYVRGSPWSWP